ncbi:hypothetical protein AB0L63_29070 [Nocardia sp. NPDC051990]|uniref:hypothetical protein n=1 Tax=Nocardia sp. NPDC051990 TaxID=3155285 RepID=UPI00341F35E9
MAGEFYFEQCRPDLAKDLGVLWVARGGGEAALAEHLADARAILAGRDDGIADGCSSSPVTC